jgi:hypothetical protein
VSFGLLAVATRTFEQLIEAFVVASRGRPASADWQHETGLEQRRSSKPPVDRPAGRTLLSWVF